MIVGVADTHTALWYLFDDKRLSSTATNFIDQAAAFRRNIAVSVISLAEIVYLIEKSRLPAHAYVDLKSALTNPNHVFMGVPFNDEVVEDMRRVSRTEVPDMPDRMVAATAIYFGVPLVTCDRRIQASSVETIR